MLLHEGTKPLRTLYEEDFGRSIADVLYFPPSAAASPTTNTAAPAAAVGPDSQLPGSLAVEQQQEQVKRRDRQHIRVKIGGQKKQLIVQSQKGQGVHRSGRDCGVYVSI
jgi:hypothetical protein